MIVLICLLVLVLCVILFNYTPKSLGDYVVGRYAEMETSRIEYNTGSLVATDVQDNTRFIEIIDNSADSLIWDISSDLDSAVYQLVVQRIMPYSSITELDVESDWEGETDGIDAGNDWKTWKKFSGWQDDHTIFIGMVQTRMVALCAQYTNYASAYYLKDSLFNMIKVAFDKIWRRMDGWNYVPNTLPWGCLLYTSPSP